MNLGLGWYQNLESLLLSMEIEKEMKDQKTDIRKKIITSIQ